MITTVTLNASIDKAYHINGSIQNGEVMRVAACRNSAGGKGLNVARIIKLCGEEVKATGMVGGFNGAYLKTLLDQDEIQHQFAHIQGETRSCINILDDAYGSTEYLEPGCEVMAEEEQSFLDETFRTVIVDSEVVAISGSVPKGVSLDVYEHMIQEVKKQGKKVILDTSGELLKNGIRACPTMVKPNQDEIEMLFGIKVKDMQDVKVYAEKIHQQGIPYVVISLGKDGAMLVCEEGIYQAKPPKLEVINTVGCGDSMVGAFVVAVKRNYPPKQALVYAVAVASANALSPNTGDFDTEMCKKIMKNIEVKQL